MIRGHERRHTERVSIDDVAVNTSDGGADRYGLTEPLNTAGVAINRYVLAPGERISGLHTHLDQEEVFVVLEGKIAFETWTESSDRSGETAAPGGEITVGAGEAIRFGSGEFQSGKNDDNDDSGDDAVVLALGAPRDREAVRIPLRCSDCGHTDRQPAVAENSETSVLVCPACGVETDAACPDCGHDSVYATLSEDEGVPIGVCRDCGVESQT